MPPAVQGQQCTGSIVTVWNSTTQVTPAPTASFGTSKRMTLRMLAAKQPVQAIQPRQVFPASCQGLQGQCRVPRCQVSVNRPATVGPNRIYQELYALLGDRMGSSARTGKAHDHETGERHRFQVAPAGGLHFLQGAETW